MKLGLVPLALIFPALFLAYWTLTKKARAQNLLILAANGVFYAWLDWRFLPLLFGGALADYFIAVAMGQSQRGARSRLLLAASLTLNLGVLGFFKYANFFAASFAALLRDAGVPAGVPTLNVLLPVGISFYTFQRLSYTLDVSRRQIAPFTDPLAFLAATTFFPLVISGPIERPRHLVPQFMGVRKFNEAAAGGAIRQILWGLFKKRIVADSLSGTVVTVFSNYTELTGSQLAAGAVIFAVQLYADFSGYSDIAIGCARLLGIRVRANFTYPYFSRDIGEFWRRWHISLSSWFRDYLFTPLTWQTPVTAKWRRLGAVLVTFTTCGLWHGANWTFVVWGFLNGLFFLPLIFGRPLSETGASDASLRRYFSSALDGARIAATFGAVCLAWIVFRADSLSQAARYIFLMFSRPWSSLAQCRQALLLAVCLLAVEWLQRNRIHALDIGHFPLITRWGLYSATCLALLLLPHASESPFIYMKF